MLRGVCYSALLFVSGLSSFAWAQVPPPNVAPGSPPPAPAPPEAPAGEKKPEGDAPAPAAPPAPARAPAPGAPTPGAPAPGAPTPGPSTGGDAAAATVLEASPSPTAPSASPAPQVGPPPAAAAPTPEPPPVASAPVVIPPVMPAHPSPADTLSPVGDAPRPPPEQTLGFAFDVGFGARLGSGGDFDLDRDEATGLVFGPSVWFAPSRLWSVGLGYERTGLGTDRSAPGESSVDVRRSLDAAWLRGRAYPWRTDHLGLYVGLGLGASWQHVDAAGTRDSGDFVRPAAPYSCGSSEGPGFALGGGAGLDVELTRSVAFVTGLDASAHRHTGDVVEGCAPGSGSVTAVGARLGFIYRLDLDEEPRGRAARRARGLARAQAR